MTNTKDFDWEDERKERLKRIHNHGNCKCCDNYCRIIELQAQADRQQLLKAVGEMGKDPKSTWEDDRGYNQALDDVLDLLKAKDYMEGL